MSVAIVYPLRLRWCLAQSAHENVESVNNYAVASNEQQHGMSDILSNKCVTMAPVNNHPLY